MKDPLNNIKYYETEVQTFYQKNKHEIFLWGGIAVLLLAVALIYTKCGPDKVVKGIVKTDVQIKKEVQYILDDHTVDSLQKVIAQKDLDKVSVEGKLKAAQESNRKLAAHEPVKVFMPISDHTQEDYIKQLQDGAYLSDSLCNEVTKQWVDLSELKDSTIKVLKTDKKILISSFNDLGYNSTMKDKAIKDLNRSLRWQKVQKVGALALAGILLFKVLTK